LSFRWVSRPGRKHKRGQPADALDLLAERDITFRQRFADRVRGIRKFLTSFHVPPGVLSRHHLRSFVYLSLPQCEKFLPLWHRLLATRHKRLDFVKYETYDKLPVLTQWKEQMVIDWNEIAYMGDDLPDIPCLISGCLSACPSNAVSNVKNVSTFISSYKGGKGAVREFCDYILSNHLS